MTPEQASKKYHWCKYNSLTNTIELYLDNYMLSGARNCEAHFYLLHLVNLQPRYTKEVELVIAGNKVKVQKRKPWFFDFGEFLHKCLESFYNSYKRTKNPPDTTWWMEQCKSYWLEMKMDEYGLDTAYKADKTKFEDIGGWPGVAGLLIEYYAYYMSLRVRIIDTEITFGHGKEVKIGHFFLKPNIYNLNDEGIEDWRDYNIECYLTGRIDLLVDNGYKIGPVDHKTTHKFDGSEHLDFNPHDGMTGYILACNEILKKYREQGLTNIPYSSGGWIYHISNCVPSTPRDKTKKQGPRFKTTPIDKNTEQLEDYKARQLSTFKRIAELLFNDKVPEWNTIACNNMFMRPCQFKPIHEQPSQEWPRIIKEQYVQYTWDTRDHSNENRLHTINGTDSKEEITK